MSKATNETGSSKAWSPSGCINSDFLPRISREQDMIFQIAEFVMEHILAGKRIFIIEDDVINLSILAASMNGSSVRIEQNVLGYDIVSHIVECLPIDLIVLDIMLRRGVNGYDIYDQIRSSPELKKIPVVAITSLDPETEIPKAKAKGFDGFISKPINMGDLPRNIIRILNGEKIWISDSMSRL